MRKAARPAGKAGVIQVHAALEPIGVGGEGGQQEPDGRTGQDTGGQGAPAVVQHEIADHGRKGSRGQAGCGIAAERLTPVPGVQTRAQQDGPQVEAVFAEKGKT